MTGHPTDRLTDFLEGTLDPAARGTVAAHLAECADCRRLLAELGAVRQRAAAWRPSPPPSDPWPTIRHAIRAAPRQRGWGRGRHRRWIVAGAVTAAAVAFLVFGRGVFRIERTPPNAPATSSADSALDAQWRELRPHLGAEVTAPVAEALTLINVSLSEITAAMVDDPGNPLLQALYERALADKVTVLMDATARLIPTRRG